MKPTNRIFFLNDDAQFTTISPPSPLTPEKSSSIAMNSSTVLVFLVLCTALLSAAFFFCFYTRCRNPSSSPAPGCKAVDPAAVVRSIPVRSYGGAAMHRICRDCAVCLGEFREGDDVKVMPFCSHVFHAACIDTWLLLHMSCPICRSTQFFEE